MLRTFALGVVAALTTQAAAQSVTFEKYQLDNGLTVILHQDRSLPVVAVNTWYRVGSKDEPPGRSGFAHLFEHLMFMGTERVPGNQFDVLMETGGGSNNATTSFDRTNYFSTGPASLLPTLLWLDADRLEDLARTMTQEKLDKQRDVVRNERRQSIENQPYGKAELMITEIMFPMGHPYHYEVIGSHADLEAAQVQDVVDFFATFYVPNNASLCVAGDFDPAAVKPMIAELFGTLPRGADPMHKAAEPVRLGRVVRATTVDQVQLPKIAFAYHSAPQMAEGDAELDLLAAVLSQGKSSRLYKRLVLDEKLAAEVSAYQSSALLQSVFRVDIIAAEGADLNRIEAVMDEELARLLKDGITSEELEQRKASIELGKVSQLQSVLAKADQLNAYNFYWGTPDGFTRDFDRYRTATPETVLAWARRTLTPDSRLIMRVLPDQPAREATPRDQRPTDLAPAAFNPPAPTTFTLANGVAVQLWTKPDLPIVSVRVVFTPGGPLDVPATAGLSGLTADMMTEGAGPYSAEAFSDAVQGLGASLDVGAGGESASASLTVVKRNLPKAVELLRLALREPAFKPEDWDRVKRLHLDAIKQQDDNPTIVAGRVGQRVLFGDASPYAWPSSGTRQTVEPLSLPQIKARAASLFDPACATVLIAGDVSRAEAEAAATALFAGWTGSRPRAAAMPIAATTSDSLRVVLVHRPRAVQTVVRFLAPGPRAGDEARVPYRLLDTILGGTFTSRLNANLREDKGYTYGARAAFQMRPSTGWFVASSSVRADVTGASLREFLMEFNRIRGGDIAPDEAAKARESIRTDLVQSFEGVAGIVGAASGLVEVGLPFASLAQDAAAMGTFDASRLNALAKDAFPIEKGVLVLVGDRDIILPQLEGLGLPTPVEYTADGVPVRP
ncbi:MAG: peptidase M16 [Phycisphaerae bacterium]|nr:MAG: peptidase M16 [Phycisphaerae bacterium]